MTVLEHIKQLIASLPPEDKQNLAEYLTQPNGSQPEERNRSLSEELGKTLSQQTSIWPGIDLCACD